MSIRISCSMVLIVWLAGCGGGGTSTSRAPVLAESPPQPADTMALQIFSLAQDTVLTPLVAQWPQDDVSEVITELQPEVDGPAATMVYRIQLYTTKDLAQATAVQREAEVDFGEPVRVDYEIPYYKVRVGVFPSPREAEVLLRDARRLGYRGAWAVRVRADETDN